MLHPTIVGFICAASIAAVFGLGAILLFRLLM
jgi:hypothetical protein